MGVDVERSRGEPQPVADGQAVRDERAALGFTAASIAFHVVLDGLAPVDPKSCRPDDFTYHQREFLSYAHRETPPFTVEKLTLPPELETVECVFAESVEYQAGGSPTLLRAARSRSIEFEARAYLMYFTTSNLGVLQLILLHDPERNSPTAERPAPLSEFEVIKLAKLWEGGEGALEPTVPERSRQLVAGDKWVRFRWGSSNVSDFSTLLEAVRSKVLTQGVIPTQPESRHAYMTGSIQLRGDSDVVDRLVAALHSLQDVKLHPSQFEIAESHRAEIVSPSGILRALVSFDDTHLHELPSIFKEARAEGRVITAVHKGPFLRLSNDGRMPSPYFLFPHSLALHNEYLLRVAVDTGAGQLDAARQRRTSWRLHPVEQLSSARREISAALDQRIDAAVIHYPSLRTLYEHAAGSRGLSRLRERAEHYAEELRVEADAESAAQRTLAQTVVAIVLLVFAGVQILVTAPLGIGIAVVALMVVAAFFAIGGYELLHRRLARGTGDSQPVAKPRS